MENYDQWKTASPFDDDPDFADLAIKMAEAIEKKRTRQDQAVWFAHHKDDISQLLRHLADHIIENT